MSDSEDDFASADEGDMETTSAAPSKGHKSGLSASNVETKATSKSPAVKDNPKPKSDKDASKSKSPVDTASVDKTNKTAKHDKKGEGTDKAEASGVKGKAEASGGASEPVKETDVKTKGKKGKQKGKKGKQKESTNKSQISSTSVDTPTDKPASDKEKATEQADTSVSDKEKPTELDSELAGKDVSDKEKPADTDSDKVVDVKVVNQTDVADTDNVNETKKPETAKVTETEKSKKSSESESANAQPSSSANVESSLNANAESSSSANASADAQNSSSSGDLTFEQKIELIKSPSSQSISRPAADHTEKQEEVFDKLASSAKEKSSGWGWGWGSSLLDVAQSSVSTFTNQVGEGFNTMIETVESTLNMPDPEELARENKASSQDGDMDTTETENADSDTKTDGNKDADKKDSKPDNPSEKTESGDKTGDQSSESREKPDDQSRESEEKTDTQSGSGWFSAWGVSNITKMVESTSKNLVTGSLDVLETLGKKTFDVINEHDPGLKKARSFLHDRGDKPNLSAMLRDAKEQEEIRVEHEKESEEARKAHFGSLFDDFQGLAHLEALEMLSNQCEKKVNVLLNALPADNISMIKPQLLLIKQNFEINEDDEEDITEQEFDALVTNIHKSLNVGTTSDKLVKSRQRIEENFKQSCETTEKGDIKEIHRVAISSLAEFTSKCIEQFHKAGELILIQKTKDYNFVDCSSVLLSFTKILTAETGILSTKFTEYLNTMEGDEEIKVNHVVTNIFLEASNSSSYIQDGFQLLLPVLQQAAIESSHEPE